MEYLVPFIVALLVTMAGIIALVRLATPWLPVDLPGMRKIHSAPIPRIGGVAMAIGVFVAALAMTTLQAQDRWFLLACAIVAIFGALDDRLDLDYRLKFAGQLIAVVIVVTLGGVQVSSITLDDRILLPAYLSVPLTVLFLVGVTNAINLADGLDGLAGGTTFLCLCAIALLAKLGDTGTCATLALVFAGAVLGFLRFNTYPASVFMGDAGSQLLGFATGVLSVRATQGAATAVSAALPVLLLAFPLLDTLSVFVQRISEGRSPFSADKNHIHHRLLALGFRQYEAVAIIYLVQAGLFVGAYLLRYSSDLLIIGVVALFFLVTIAALQIASRAGWRARHPQSLMASLTRLRRGVRHLPLASYLAIVFGLGIFATTIVAEVTTVLSRDIRTLLIALLALVGFLLCVKRDTPLNVIEKVALYVTATVLVYLDTFVLPASKVHSTISWVAVSIMAVAVAIRLRLSYEKRFRLTPLDLIVLFMALVVPSVLGSLGLPHGGALAIAKLFVVYYAVEMLIAQRQAMWMRVATASVLASLALRSLL